MEHDLHVLLRKEGHDLFALNGNVAYRNGDDHFLFGAVQVVHGYFGAGDVLVVEAVLVDVRFYAVGGVDKSVLVNKGEALQLKQRPHSALVCLEMGYILQVLRRQKAEGGVYVVYVVVQVVLNDLFPASRQLVQIE